LPLQISPIRPALEASLASAFDGNGPQPPEGGAAFRPSRDRLPHISMTLSPVSVDLKVSASQVISLH
jgi:hypothetical protein